ncbi:DUF3244 domain-containing protein [Bacteroides sp. UBA939]|uniref:DUF3244 domain-containing protein n=1 Tax=Bacteroides sp. UBA939 TaxID=1946092 RepID=UPI0025BD74CE|nr:DUF3244 domain-containing protein [Bacteroides sp. UBA939]
MKTLILFFLLFTGSTNIYAQAFNGGREIILQCSKETKPKDKTGGTDKDTPIRRTISFQSVYAYLYNNVITVTFENALSDISINIFDESTGDVVYTRNCNNLNDVSIDLNGENSGSYIIEIISNGSLFEGSFTL